MVSLPYDHAYVDLMQVALEIPAATGLTVYDASLGAGIGLERSAPDQPWSRAW